MTTLLDTVSRTELEMPKSPRSLATFESQSPEPSPEGTITRLTTRNTFGETSIAGDEIL